MRKRILTPLIIIATLIPTTPALASEKPSQQFKCPKAMKMAREAGFPRRALPTLDRIVYRESKCEPKAVGWNYRKPLTHRDCKLSKWQTYRKCKAVRSADFGLTQINDNSWLTYLRQKNIIETRADLLDPLTNMKAAKALYDYSIEKGHDAWKQWDTKKPNGSGNVSRSTLQQSVGNGKAR
jgi:hypothetical protein